MLKMKKEKMIISLVVVALLALIFGNATSNATSLTGNSVTLNVSATNSTTLNISTNKTNTTNTNTNTNKSSINAAVSNYANTNSKVNTAKNTANTSKLPYAGNGNVAGAIALAVIFVGSAVYAYKKVSDYNV